MCARIREEQEVWAMSTAEQIRATIEPALAPLGLVIEDVTISPAGKRRVVRDGVDVQRGRHHRNR